MKIEINTQENTFTISGIGTVDNKSYPMPLATLRRIEGVRVTSAGRMISGSFKNIRSFQLLSMALNDLWQANQTIEGLKTAREHFSTVVPPTSTTTAYGDATSPKASSSGNGSPVNLVQNISMNLN